ncbi:uncharacterized protein LOC144764209 [Lissotriton helveticus]
MRDSRDALVWSKEAPIFSTAAKTEYSLAANATPEMSAVVTSPGSKECRRLDFAITSIWRQPLPLWCLIFQALLVQSRSTSGRARHSSAGSRGAVGGWNRGGAQQALREAPAGRGKRLQRVEQRHSTAGSHRGCNRSTALLAPTEASKGGKEAQHCWLPQRLERVEQRHRTAGSHRGFRGWNRGTALLAPTEGFRGWKRGPALLAPTEASEGGTEARHCWLPRRLQRVEQRHGTAGSHGGFRGWNRGTALLAPMEASEGGTEAPHCWLSQRVGQKHNTAGSHRGLRGWNRGTALLALTEGGTEAQHCWLPQRLQRVEQRHSTAGSHKA